MKKQAAQLYIYMYWRYLNLTFEETGSTVTTNAQIVLDRQLVRNEYLYDWGIHYTLFHSNLTMHNMSITYIYWGSVCVVPLHVALTVALPNNIN